MEMDNGTIILVIMVSIIISIFNIALFVKIWIMTSDVGKIKNNLLYVADTDGFRNEMRKLLILGDKNSAKKIILNSFFEALKNNDDNFIKSKEELRYRFEKIGEPVPNEIMKLNSIEDFKEIF